MTLVNARDEGRVLPSGDDRGATSTSEQALFLQRR